jgi:hypothetical protein
MLDWDDVLRRAGALRSQPRRRPRRARASLVLAVIAAVAVMAAPALGIGQRLRMLIGLAPSTDSGLALTATLRSPSDSGSARLELRTSGIAILAQSQGRPVRPLMPVSAGQGGSGVVRWRLTLVGVSDQVRSLRLVSIKPGSPIAEATLCAPCASGVAGSFRPTRAMLAAMFNGSIRAQLDTEAGSRLSGRVALARPQRLVRPRDPTNP